MTLCVAANCFHNNKSYAVFGADFSVESSIAKAEIEPKTKSICREDYPALLAGSSSRAREFMTILDEIWDSNDQIKVFFFACKEAIKRHKNALADEYISARLGVSYEELLRSVHQSLPEETYRGLIDDIARMKLGCDLILIHFDADKDSFLIRINDDGTIEACTNFAAIGSGMYCRSIIIP